MLTFLAVLHHKWANFPSLKLSVSAIIGDVESVDVDLWRTDAGHMKKINNHMDPPNIQ